MCVFMIRCTADHALCHLVRIRPTFGKVKAVDIEPTEDRSSYELVECLASSQELMLLHINCGLVSNTGHGPEGHKGTSIVVVQLP